MSTVTPGGLVLWFGWFGFDPGSIIGVGDGSAIAHIAVTTNTVAAMALLNSTAASRLLQKKPDLSMIINGALAGLVAITAPCAFTEFNLLDKVRFEIAVNDDFVKPAVDAIIKGARSGKIGDGKIFVLPMEECIRVRTGEVGSVAVG
ncbi:MAG: hypothetical protein HGB33_09035 [Syntrophaceae bacterium]|nr:hypothetical protein [Syntrophaceae bacterium]